MDNNPSNTLLALLAGVAIGAGLGILFAPDSGENTRRKIKDGVEDYGDELKGQLKGLNEKIRSTVAGESEQAFRTSTAGRRCQRRNRTDDRQTGSAAGAAERTACAAACLSTAMSRLKESAEALHEDVQALLETQAEYYKLWSFKAGMKSVTLLIHVILLGLFMALTLLFASIAAAFWLWRSTCTATPGLPDRRRLLSLR